MSMLTRAEIDIAARAGVDLLWLDGHFPDVAASWRREHVSETTGEVHARLAALPL